MKNYRLIICIISLLFRHVCLSQSHQPPKFLLSTGYGIAGSFFVRSYEEFVPVPSATVFYKKRFLGTTQTAALGINLKNNWEARFGINYQHFTRKIYYHNTVNNIEVIFDHDIHHRDYMWFGSVLKKIKSENNFWNVGLGLYYLRPKQEEVEIFYPTLILNVERDFKNSRLEEGGVIAEFAYEHKFQHRVNIGLKSQFYYTASAGYAESVTLFPYVKFLF